MNTPTRTEFDARIETIEVRMDARVQSIESKIDNFTTRIDERMRHIEDSAKETQASISGLKTTLIVTAIATVLSIVFGVAAFNATVLSNMVASFESGKNTSAAQAEVKKQAEDTAALLCKIQDDLAAQKVSPSRPPPKK